MDEKINIKKALLAFNTIVNQGHRDGHKYVLNGLTAYTGFDGYDVTIYNDYVRLDIFFHNKISFRYSSNKEKMLFLEKLNIINQNNRT